jgi:hypothetical protein
MVGIKSLVGMGSWAKSVLWAIVYSGDAHDWAGGCGGALKGVISIVSKGEESVKVINVIFLE